MEKSENNTDQQLEQLLVQNGSLRQQITLVSFWLNSAELIRRLLTRLLTVDLPGLVGKQQRGIHRA